MCCRFEFDSAKVVQLSSSWVTDFMISLMMTFQNKKKIRKTVSFILCDVVPEISSLFTATKYSNVFLLPFFLFPLPLFYCLSIHLAIWKLIRTSIGFFLYFPLYFTLTFFSRSLDVKMRNRLCFATSASLQSFAFFDAFLAS